MVFPFHQLTKILHFSQGLHRQLQLALVVFFLGALAHLLMCSQMIMHKLQLALCGGGSYYIIPGTSIHQRKLEQDAATTQLTQNYEAYKCPCASYMLLLHPTVPCADRWYMVPCPLTFSNLCCRCFSFQQLAQTLYLHLY